MKKNLVSLYLLIICSVPLHAQQLYFIRATANINYDFYYLPPVQIITYRPRQDTVLQLRKDYTEQLNIKVNQLRSIVYYPEFKTFCFNMSDFSTYTLSTKGVDTIVELVVQCPSGYENSPTGMNIINGHWAYECVNYNASDADFSRFKGVDFSLSKHFDMSAADFKDMHLTGTVTQHPVVLQPNDGYMYLPIVADIENRPPFSVMLPQKYWVNKESYSTILVNDNQKTLIQIKRINPAPHAAYGQFYAALYNKRRNTWSEVELKGNSPTIMAYGRWIVGAAQDETDWDTKFFIFDKKSPGKTARDSVPMEASFDEMSVNSFYRPGLLYLFNTDTEKYIEIDTRQGDSEILLVEDEVVYYRVFDRIYKAKIIKGEQLDTPELLVKDSKVVPQIHWAFFGKPGKPQAIATDKSTIYSEPNKPTRMYLIKGNVVTVLEEKDGWLKIEYEGKKLVTGWIKKEDTQK